MVKLCKVYTVWCKYDGVCDECIGHECKHAHVEQFYGEEEDEFEYCCDTCRHNRNKPQDDICMCEFFHDEVEKEIWCHFYDPDE